MNSSEIAEDIDRLFTSYTAAFERQDAGALATHFVYPCQIVADNQPVSVTSIGNAQEYAAIITRFLELYRRAGVATGEIVDLSLALLSDGVAYADTRWRVCDRSETTLYEFESLYTLIKGSDGWRIAAIAHNELPHLREVLKPSG